MAKVRTGGPAFPFEYHNQTSKHQEGFFDTGLVAPDGAQQFAGMSLRDYFAAKAMASLTSVYWEIQDEFESGESLIKCQAESAYEMADAMLVARGE